MPRLLLVRHGETDWNCEGRLQGHAATHLNERGREQARALAELLARSEPLAIHSSDLPRAVETAEIVAARTGAGVVLDPDLREIDVGSWQGRTQAELDGAPWDGESYEAHRARVLAALERIARTLPEPADAPVVVVTHGGCIRRVQEAVLGDAPPVLHNCGVYGLRFRAGQLVPLD